MRERMRANNFKLGNSAALTVTRPRVTSTFKYTGRRPEDVMPVLLPRWRYQASNSAAGHTRWVG